MPKYGNGWSSEWCGSVNGQRAAEIYDSEGVIRGFYEPTYRAGTTEQSGCHLYLANEDGEPGEMILNSWVYAPPHARNAEEATECVRLRFEHDPHWDERGFGKSAR